MQLNSGLDFPIQVAHWSLSNGGRPIQAYYHEWDKGQNAPYAGGFGTIIWNLQGGGGTNQLAVYWVAPGRFALQATDTGIYAAIDQGEYKYGLGLTDGTYAGQGPNTSITSNGTFDLHNVGDGKASIAIAFNGQYLSVNYADWTADWGFYVPGPNSATIGPYETITVNSASQFPILLISASGVGLNLTNVDLSQGGYIRSVAGVDFTRAILTNARLSTLPVPSVAGCNFTNASLNGTIMTGVQNLNQTTWAGAILRSTDLSGVDPGGTANIDFSNADLGQVTFSNGQPFGSNYDYSNAQFVHSNLAEANMSNVNFSGANFTGANLSGANLTGACLYGANLTNANFTGATLAGTNLTSAILSGTLFNNVDLRTTILGPTPVFGRSTTTATKFQNAIVPAPSLGRNWSYIDLTGATVIDLPSDLSGLVAENTLFPNEIELGGLNFQHANFSSAQLFYADFTGADLGFATLDGAFLKGAKLNSANLSGATLTGVWLIAEGSGGDPSQYEAAQVVNAYLINTVLDQSQAAGVDFSGSLFVTDPILSSTQASAQNAFMVRSIFTDAIVVQVNCRGTQFSGAQFENTILIGSTFPSCQINPTSDVVHSVPTMRDANICGALFADVAGGLTTNPANMDGLEMAGAQYSTNGSLYNPTNYTDYYGKPVMLYVDYGATVLGTTTQSTTCPNGQNGPCTL